jgi:ATP/maltotriose-dependent transcriptional regulator MalT
MVTTLAKPRLSDSEIDRIVGVLITWKDELSWDFLLRRVDILIGRSFSRQGLHKQDAIAAAFRQAKSRLRSKSKSKRTALGSEVSPEFALMRGVIESLEQEVKSLKDERHRYREKFATWLYNARVHGKLSSAQLNESIPPIDRGRSDNVRRYRV